MIQSGKVVVSVLAMHCAVWITMIGPFLLLVTIWYHYITGVVGSPVTVGRRTLGAYLFPPINSIPVKELIVDIFLIHFACSIM